MKKVLGYLKDEQGIETLEWIAVGVHASGWTHHHRDRDHQ